jgi:hypothetical protein
LRLEGGVPAGDGGLRLAREDLRDEFTEFLTDMLSVRNAAQ